MSGVARAAALSLLLVMLAVGVTLAAGTAAAHATRVATEPAENAVLNTGPARVSATFNERLQTTFAAMAVVGPDGNLWSSGDAQVQGAVVSIAVRPLGPAGSYTVNYRVTSADGHVVTGSWSFLLSVPGTGTAGPATYTQDNPDGGVPAWPFAVGAVVLVAGAVVWAVRHRA
jgi:methionine-rich copper-binding protein CopC